ncbi:MAG TPA: DUF6036 family nucleotidyltransferase [Longimicrobiaceae bacterium]|nr:DUF6036 family nucleotidyltransferase [Longimicrobiaceae bacterium]
MTREQLEHAIRAACDVAGERAVIVFGSQSILGQYPDASRELRQSMEADVAPGSNDPDVADRIDGALGEDSAFQQAHGFYVHGLTLDAAALPRGWERRVVVVSNERTRGSEGRCLEAHDLAASKLAAFRDKDRDFVRTLLAEGLISIPKLILRVGQLERCAIPAERILKWIEVTQRDLADAPRGRGQGS